MLHTLALINYPWTDPTAPTALTLGPIHLFNVYILGPIHIRWYGISYLLGFVLAYLLLGRLRNSRVLHLSSEKMGDLIGWLALGVVAGGRTGWWIFYHKPPESLPEKWWEPIAIWHGGMSFHGGLAGVILVLLVWSRLTKSAFLNIADCLALVTPIGLCLGRIANFINQELWGRGPTNVPWAMIFPKDKLQFPRHPSQLYESLLEGPVLLAIVWLAKRLPNRRNGQIAAVFVAAYGVIRFGVEFTREPDAQLGYIAWNWLTMGQILSTVIFLIGVIWWVWLRQNSKLAALAPEPQMEVKQPTKRGKK